METHASGLTVLALEAALLECPDLVRPHLGSLVPVDDPGPLTGTFIHVAAGVVVVDPLQPFFGREAERIAASSRTLIVAEQGSSIAYIEGCAAPIYTPHSDRSSAVEIVVGPGATVRHTTIQNWSTNVRTTVDKHATVAGGGRIEWIDAALGSLESTTRLVTRLDGDAASASVLSMISAGMGQRHDAEFLTAHEGAATSSTALSKLLGSGTGSVTSRHVLHMESATSRADARSEALCVEGSPEFEQSFAVTGGAAGSNDNRVARSSTEEGLDERQLRYLMQRGLSRSAAAGLLVTGYLRPIARSLPLEYSVEWEQAIQFGIAQAMA